jgi:hypothetical protein
VGFEVGFEVAVEVAVEVVVGPVLVAATKGFLFPAQCGSHSDGIAVLISGYRRFFFPCLTFLSPHHAS